jgi:hypothetical protein
MKIPVFPRALGLLALYGAMFVALVFVQFTKKEKFTQQVGRAVVSGQYRAPEEGESPADSDEILLEGGASVFFGGLEFRLREEADNFSLVARDGGRQKAAAEGMRVSGETVSFRLSGGSELIFASRSAGSGAELQISGTFAEDAAGVDLPFRVFRSAWIREGGDGQLTVTAKGVNYTFSRLNGGTGGNVIPLRAGGGPVVYRAAPEKKAFTPEDFILAAAASPRTYNEYLDRWRDQNFSLWGRTVGSRNDEDMVIAYGGEAVRRGVYRTAVSAVSPAFREGPRRTYESSVYLGGMRQALQSFISLEREKINRLSRQINEKSPDFLKEPQVFEYLALRSQTGLFEDGVELIRSLEPPELNPDLAPGVFESWLDMNQYRGRGDNPFDRLIDPAVQLVSEGVRRVDEIRGPQGAPQGDETAEAGSWALVFRGDSADTEYNLRLGRALTLWAEAANRDDWAGLGRSLVVSVLSLTGEAGTAPQSLRIGADGRIRKSAPQISGARLHRLLRPGDHYPRPALIRYGTNGIWAWTAASALSAVQANEVLDIAVSFPPGETHFMMIRGIRPFTKIQLYDMDFRTDPEFERYDSSGWVYSAQEQILSLKMKHRAAVQHIRIFY